MLTLQDWLAALDEVEALMREIAERAAARQLPLDRHLVIEARGTGGSRTGSVIRTDADTFLLLGRDLLPRFSRFDAVVNGLANDPTAREHIRADGRVLSEQVASVLTKVAYDYFKPSNFAAPVDRAEVERVLGGVINPTVLAVPRTRIVEPLINLRLTTGALELPEGISLHPADDRQVEAWANGRSSARDFGITEEEFLEVWCFAQIEFDGDARTEHQKCAAAQEKLRDLVAVLQLVVDCDVEALFTETIQLPDQRVSASFSSKPRRGGTRGTLTTATATQSQLTGAWSHADRLRAPKPALATRRWRDAAQRDREDDRLLDYWVALEALYLPGVRDELSFRAAIRIAAFLESEGAARRQMFDRMRESYGERSRLVHGDAPKQNLGGITSATRQAVRRTLLRLLTDDAVPDPSQAESTLWR